MHLEYFQMIDHIEAVNLDEGTLDAKSTVPAQSPVFEGHFPGMPLVPGVLLIETMAQACGYLLLANSNLTEMPFLMAVDIAKMRDFVKPETSLDISAKLVHKGSGYAVASAAITSDGKKLTECQLKFRTVSFEEVPIADIVIARAREVGLMAAMANQTPAPAGEAQ